MSSYLCLSVIFLARKSQGRCQRIEGEWPPAPLRLFQALVASATAHWRNETWSNYARPALEWLEKQSPPRILAPRVRPGTPHRLPVPNNNLDIVTTAWARNQILRKQPADLKIPKAIRTDYFPGAKNKVLYLWSLSEPLTEEVRQHIEVLTSIARKLVALGWGQDLVMGDGCVLSPEECEQLFCESDWELWRPTPDAHGNSLRVPQKGTLIALTEHYQDFLRRLQGEGLNGLDPPDAYSTVDYSRDTDPPRRPLVAFEIWRPLQQLDGLPASRSRLRPFDAVRQTPLVADMVRHILAEAAARTRPAWRDTFVLGHGDGPVGQATTNCRCAYLPLPSLERRRPRTALQHVGMIRRLLVVGPPGAEAQISWVRQMLSGQELIDEQKGPLASLTLISSQDPHLQSYLRPAAVWATVTPVILPGYDDQQAAKTERLLRKALIQADFPEWLVQHADIQWRLTGYWPGTNLARHYRVPEHLEKYPRYHVWLRWCNVAGRPIEIPGPIVFGGGRFCGLGLLAALPYKARAHLPF